MVGLLGTIGPFERDTDDWTSYCEQLQQFFMVNKTERRAVLLSVCYQLIVAPSKPTDKSSCG